MLKGLGGLGDIGKMMKQAQEMQTKMAELQEKLETMEVSGAAGAGMVTAVCTGRGQLKSVTVDPSLFVSGDAEAKAVLEDLVVAAVNDAQSKAQEKAQEEMQALTAGLPLPPGMVPPS